MGSVPTIVIIGGGFSGTMVAAQLLRQATGPLAIKLIERTPQQLCRGVAYSTQADSHLLNVPAGNMSAYGEDAEHFLRWANSGEYSAQAWPRPINARSYLPRMLYGEYLQWTLDQARAQCSVEVHLEVIHDEAVRIHPMPFGASVELASGDFMDGERVVLALGNFPPSNPTTSDSSFYGSAHFLPNPWADSDPELWENARSCLIVGSGLSMVDWVLRLLDHGYTGKLHVVSRHGLKPNANALTREAPLWLPPEIESMTIRNLLHRFRKSLGPKHQPRHEWRELVDAVRPHAAELWRSLGLVEQRRFLRHLRPLWDNHRHRIAPAAAVKLEQLGREGRLIYHKGRIEGYVETQGQIAVKLRACGGKNSDALLVDRVINCTGMACDYRKIQHPLIENLFAQGLVQADPLSLGLLTGSLGGLVDTAGLTSDVLFTLGPPRRGTLWETTAVPEIREQAKLLAAVLLEKTVFQTTGNPFNQSRHSA